MTSSSSTYEYLSLPGKRYIRLLRLGRRFPRSTSTVSSSLINLSLDAAPKFEAISYRWQEPRDASNILIDGRPFPVSTAVAEMLSDFSSLWRPRLVWIDAICINQSDNEERSSQVQLMRDIYQRAEHVLVWLGNPSTAKHFIDTVFPYLKAAAARTEDNWDHFETRSLRRADFYAVVSLLDNPYWSRTWIIQEIAVARSALIAYGPSPYRCMMTWHDFNRSFVVPFSESTVILGLPNMNFTFDTEDFNYPFQVTSRTIRPLINIDRFRSMQHSRDRSGTTLHRVIWHMDETQATDPRDKIFGIVGLLADGESDLLRPDYTKPVTAVYRDAAAHLLLAGEDPLRVLHFAGLRRSLRRMSALPSWVPDFSISWPPEKLLAPPDRPVPYRAGGESKPSVHVNGDTLRLRGVRVEVITSIATVVFPIGGFQSSGEEDEMVNARRQYTSWHDEVFGLAMRDMDDALSDYGGTTNQTRFDAFWRTLMGDREDLRDRPSYSDSESSSSSRSSGAPVYPAPADLYEGYISCYFRISKDESVPKTLGSTVDDGAAAAASQAAAPMKWIEKVMTHVYTSRRDSLHRGLRNLEEDFDVEVGKVMEGRRFAVVGSRNRWMAVVPATASVGDEIWVVMGSETPHCLRRSEWGGLDENSRQLVGECYVHGIMRGEAMEMGCAVEDIYLR